MTVAPIIALSFMLASFLTADVNQRAVPDAIASKNPHRTAPLWIAAIAAFTSTGALRDTAVTPGERRRLQLTQSRVLQRRASRADSGSGKNACLETFGDPSDVSPDMDPSTSWADVLDHAKGGDVFSGRIVDTRLGLFSGIPFTILAVDVTRSTEWPKPNRVYLLYPSGSLTIDGVTLCTADSMYQPLPAPNDRVLFVATTPLDLGGVVYRVPPERMFFEHGESLIVPKRTFTDSATAPFRDFESVESRLLDRQRAASAHPVR